MEDHIGPVSPYNPPVFCFSEKSVDAIEKNDFEGMSTDSQNIASNIPAFVYPKIVNDESGFIDNVVFEVIASVMSGENMVEEIPIESDENYVVKNFVIVTNAEPSRRLSKLMVRKKLLRFML